MDDSKIATLSMPGSAQTLSPRAWTPGPLHWLMGVTHAVGIAAIAAQPPLWPWAVGAMFGSHALNLGFGLVPGSSALGPVITRLPPTAAARNEVALTFDDGPDPEVTPRVLDLLDSAGARGTFFCVGMHARTHPLLVRQIVARGHAVENHAFAHSRAFGFYGVGRLVRDVGDAQKVLADTAGVTPQFFRAPYGVRTPLTEPALARLGLRCVAWSVRSLDSVDSDADRVAARVMRRLAPRAIVLLHDGGEGRSASRGACSVLGALPKILSAMRARSWRSVTLRNGLAV